MPEQTDRLALPLLASGQAQKEVTHNEAQVIADFLVQPVVESVAPASVPASPSPGQCWIVGPGATGAWAGHDGAIACWTSGGWRFSGPFSGMCAWSAADNSWAIRAGATWEVGVVRAASVRVGANQVVGARQGAIASPSGGATIDAESRSAINVILTALRAHGLIAT
jgi:Protein of unknown function (DUF2793)